MSKNASADQPDTAAAVGAWLKIKLTTAGHAVASGSSTEEEEDGHCVCVFVEKNNNLEKVMGDGAVSNVFG